VTRSASCRHGGDPFPGLPGPSSGHGRAGPVSIGLILFLSAMAARCSPPATTWGPDQPDDSRAWIEVENHQHTRIRAYAQLSGGTLIPLGGVGSLEWRLLRIPVALTSASPVRLIVDPLGTGPTFRDSRVALLHQ